MSRVSERAGQRGPKAQHAAYWRYAEQVRNKRWRRRMARAEKLQQRRQT